MSPALDTARACTSTRQPPRHNKLSHSAALSYSSSSGYSTQSLSELDCHSSTKTSHKNDNTSHLTPNYSQSTSRTSLEPTPNLNILNPSNLSSTSSVLTHPSVLSYIRTSTPTNPINSRDNSSIQSHHTRSNNQRKFNKINFNPTCNSSLQSTQHSRDTWARRIDYDSDYSPKTTPVSSILSEQAHSVFSSIQPVNYKLAYRVRESHASPEPVSKQARIKWTGQASRLFTFVAKLFSCLNIFSIIKTPKTTERVLTRRPTKTNHSVIELYRSNMIDQVTDKQQHIRTKTVPVPVVLKQPSQHSRFSDNLNGSFIDTDSNYLRFADGPNYVASTPIDTINRRYVTQPVVAIINKSKIMIDEDETYDNVPSEFTKSTNFNQQTSTVSPSLASLSNQSTQVGLNLNMQPSKYSTFVAQSPPIYENCKSGDSGTSIESSVNVSGKQSEYYLSMMALNREQRMSVDYRRSDFIDVAGEGCQNSVTPGQNKTKFLRVINNSRFRPTNAQGRPVHDDLLCDKEVESYFDTRKQPVVINQMVFQQKPIVDSGRFIPAQNDWMTGCVIAQQQQIQGGLPTSRVIQNRGFQRTSQAVVVRNVRNCRGLIGSGVVRQIHGESYC